ncbi:MAG: hypothetical protein AAGC55_03745 [Myxococcota bacterium]
MTHEGLVTIFRECPELAAHLLRDALRLPERVTPRIEATNLSELEPAEYRADVVVTFADESGTVHRAAIIEIQLSRSSAKRKSWPSYVTGVHTRLDCPVILVVITLEPALARWCSEPIDLGLQRFVLHPLVMGPETIPRYTDPEAIRDLPELGILSVAAHGRSEGAEQLGLAAVAALDGLDNDRGPLYLDLIHLFLSEAARHAVESLMALGNYEYQSDFAKRYVAKGHAEGLTEGRAEGRAEGLAEGQAMGRAEGLLVLLEARGFAVPEPLRQRILATHELDVLDTWCRRAARATDLTEIFEDPTV